MSIKSNRFEVLDSLRGIAAFSVMLYHYLYGYHNEFGFSSAPIFDFRLGFFGVELFFIISGFVIFFSISNSKSIRDFMIKRLIRLFPTYWLCIIVTFLIVSYFGLSPERNVSTKDAVFNLTMLQGVFHFKLVDSSYWSLQIELFFYFFISTVFILKFQRYMNLILCGWLALIFFYNFVYRIPGAGLFFNLQYGMFFIAGIGFYKLKMQGENTILNHFIILCSYLAGILVLKNMNGYLWGISTAYVIFYLVAYDLMNFLNNRVLLFIGKISYALYLLHHHIGLVILQQLKFMGYNNPLVVVIPIIISVFLAWLATDYYDKYVSRWLREKLTTPRLSVGMA